MASHYIIRSLSPPFDRFHSPSLYRIAVINDTSQEMQRSL